MKKIKVIYIAGAGRSGSTVLGTVLGDNVNVESVGELVNAPKAFINREEYCACGERVKECRFWGAVKEKWLKFPGMEEVSDLAALQCRYEDHRKLPYLLVSRLLKTKRYIQYLNSSRNMYRAVAHVSGKQILVDSSKSPIRVFALSKMPGIDFRVIHLVRDGRGVTWSLTKSFKKDPTAGIQRDIRPKPVWRTALFWLVINGLSEILVGRALKSKYIRIRYEDFVEDSDAILKYIGAFVGVDYADTRRKIRNEEAVALGHTVAGNRARMAGIIRLKPDYAWKRLLPKKNARVYWLIAGLLAKNYGYKKVYSK